MHVSLLVKTTLVAATLALVPQIAAAQFGYYGYTPYDSGFSNGGWGAYNTNKNIAAGEQIASESRAMSQNSMVQSGIRDTLVQQDQARNQAVIDKRQADKGMWFQTQQSQMAQRRALSAATASPDAGWAEMKRDDERELIKWPRLLMDPLFTRTRARIEAPYLRSGSGLSQPTAQDYRAMINTVTEMKELENYASGYTVAQHTQAAEFLDGLASEAQQRAVMMEAAAKAPAKSGK
jgi:hypothetical protein